MARTIFLGVAGSLALALGAGAQTPPPLVNAGFETLNVFSGSGEPLGWHNISNPTNAKRRFVGDTESPQVFATGTPGVVAPHSGDAMIELRTGGFGGFVGFTTDTVNFSIPTFPFYDMLYDWENEGDIIITAKYMIPTNQAMTNDAACIKVNVKVGNQDAGGAFENYDPLSPDSIHGTTNFEWRDYKVHIFRQDIRYRWWFETPLNTGGGCGCVPVNPKPNHVKLTPSRFRGDGQPTAGRVYFDDLTYQAYCPADTDDGSGTGTPDGGVDISDLLFYLSLFDQGALRADFDDGSGTGLPDNGVDISDLLYYLTRFELGC